MRLVAYAPYDISGDLELYWVSGKLNWTVSGAILWNQADLSSSTDIDIDKVAKFDKSNSFVTMNNRTKWIFIDSSWNSPSTPSFNDFLKYDLSSLNLWTDDFAIEMSVRGGALKRASWKYYLYSNDSNKLRIMDWKLNYLSGAFSWDNVIDSSFSWSINGFNNNEFYKVIVNRNKVIIKDNSWNEKYSTWHMNANWIFSLSWNLLYIGSNDFNNFQLNDIIDYVKIYK